MTNPSPGSIAARTDEGRGHTPGPWRSECFAVYAPDGRMIFHTGFGLLPPSRSEEAEANARLIAAATDLLAACEADFIQVYMGPGTRGAQVLRLAAIVVESQGQHTLKRALDDMANAIEAALAKAGR